MPFNEDKTSIKLTLRVIYYKVGLVHHLEITQVFSLNDPWYVKTEDG
jgi:hypothetical protein